MRQRSGRWDDRAGLKRLPRLTSEQRRALDAIFLTDGKLVGRKFQFRGKPCRIGGKILRNIRRLGLMEVVQLQPAVYRLTHLGQLARRYSRLVRRDR